MHLKSQGKNRVELHWWHHAAIVGVLGVGALYVVNHLYSGMLLFYDGPGHPHWIDEIVTWWHLVFGSLLGVGVGVWLPKSLGPAAVRRTGSEPDMRTNVA